MWNVILHTLNDRARTNTGIVEGMEVSQPPSSPLSLTKITNRVRHLVATLRTWPWRDTFWIVKQRFAEDRLGVTASSLTFTTTMALVPLFTVMLAAFTAFPGFLKFEKSLQQYFIKSLIPDSIAKPVLTGLTDFSNKANQVGAMGLIFLVVTAFALMLTIDRTLNNIWRVKKPRPMAQRLLLYWSALTLGPLVVGVSLSLTSYAISASKGLVPGMPDIWSYLLSAIELLMFTSAMSALFYYVPNTRVRWTHATTGGIVVAVGFIVAKKALSWYLTSIGTYTTIYGAFAAVPIFLIWIYLAWVIVLLGAIVAAYTPSLQLHLSRRMLSPGHRFSEVIRIIQALDTVRHTDQHGLTLFQLSRQLRADPLQIEAALETLIHLYWVGRLEDPIAPRYILLTNPDATPAHPLISRFLLEHSPEVNQFWHRAQFSDMNLREII